METIEMTKAEENCLRIAGLVKKLHYDFLELGGLLLENQENAYWGEQAESFKDFVQQLGVNYSWATGLMRVAKLVVDQILTKDELAEIGPAKAVLLLPSVKDGHLSDEVKAIARDGTYNDLRLTLGHNLSEESGRVFMLCPRCANEFEELACPKCGVSISVQRGMLRSR